MTGMDRKVKNRSLKKRKAGPSTLRANCYLTEGNNKVHSRVQLENLKFVYRIKEHPNSVMARGRD